MMQNRYTKNLISILLLFLIAIIGVAYFNQVAKEQDNFLYTDFGKFYVSEQLLLKNSNPYAQVIIDNKETPPKHHLEKDAGNLNPPFFDLLILPLGMLSFSKALWLWSLLSLACAAISSYQLQRILKLPASFNLYTGLLAALLIYFPTFTNIVFGQVVLILLPLTIGAWWAARENKTITLGFILGLLANIKIFFGLFVIYFIVRREWRAFFWFSLTFLMLSALPLIFFGGNIYQQYYHELHNIWWYTSSWNASFYGFFTRLFGIGEQNIALIPITGLATKLYWLSSGILISALIIFLQPSKKIPQQQKTDLDFSIILVSMLLLSPLGWSYYFTFLIIAYIVLLRNIIPNRNQILLLSLVCFAVILTSNPHTFEGPKDVKGIIDILGWSGYYFYGLLIILGLLFYTRRQFSKNSISTNTQPQIELITLFCIIMLIPSLLGILKSSNSVAKPEFAMPHISLVKIKDN